MTTEFLTLELFV